MPDNPAPSTPDSTPVARLQALGFASLEEYMASSQWLALCHNLHQSGLWEHRHCAICNGSSRHFWLLHPGAAGQETARDVLPLCDFHLHAWKEQWSAPASTHVHMLIRRLKRAWQKASTKAPDRKTHKRGGKQGRWRRRRGK